MLLRRSIMSSALDSDGNITGNFNTAQNDVGRYVTYGAHLGSSMDTVNISYGGWFYVDSTGTHVNNYLLGAFSSAGPFTSRYNRTTGMLNTFQIIGGVSNQCFAAVSEDTWNFFTATYDGTTGKLNVNGALIDSSVTISGNLVSTGGVDVRCGRQSSITPSSNDFEGSYTLMNIYGSALSLAEHQSIYNSGLALLPEDFPPAINAKLTMGCPLSDAVVDPLVDRSGGGHDAVLNGGIIYTTPTIEFG